MRKDPNLMMISEIAKYRTTIIYHIKPIIALYNQIDTNDSDTFRIVDKV
jgi:hypothetical protein